MHSFVPIDTFDKAYTLGMITSSIGVISHVKVEDETTSTCITILINCLNNNKAHWKKITNLFNVDDEFNVDVDEKYIDSYIRGYLDSLLTIDIDNLTIKLNPENKIHRWIIKQKKLHSFDIHGNQFVDFVGEIYKDTIGFKTSSENFISLTHKSYEKNIKPFNTFKYVLSPGAIAPTKNNETDTGYDLTVIDEWKRVNNNVIIYETGVAVQPPQGYYFDVVLRSSMSKSGWSLANNVGIIDASYTGTLKIALVRLVGGSLEIKLPMRIAQLIPRRLHLLKGEQVETLTDTVRGNDGGVVRC